MSYIFEEVNEKHLPVITDIYNYYVINSTATFHKHVLTDDEMKEILFFSNPLYKSFAILDDDGICGYCILSQYKKREAFDCTAEVVVYLRHDFIGKGVGNLALKHIEDLAVKNGFHGLVAIICGENDKSIKLFERNGYEKCAHYREVGIKFDRLLDIVCYQKLLK